MNLNYSVKQFIAIVFYGCLFLNASPRIECRELPIIEKKFTKVIFNNEEMVIRYLKSIQDNFSTDALLVPAMEDNSGQTFNNAVTAMAFILLGEKERAGRILDFYAVRTDSSNLEINYQNFFCSGDSRGFYQNIDLDNSYYPFISDRWMGDNAWLLIAYKYYESEYGFNEKPLYVLVTTYLKNLLLEFYID
ncbi:MAG TPA: hypothetical protein VLB50_07595, partial [Ignavibacteriaceae bacterium]|nr:hypothetical protein [Ignavibacteriaceae bacterium]